MRKGGILNTRVSADKARSVQVQVSEVSAAPFTDSLSTMLMCACILHSRIGDMAIMSDITGKDQQKENTAVENDFDHWQVRPTNMTGHADRHGRSGKST